MRRLIVEPMDPRVEVAGGVDTCIRGLIKYAPSDFEFSILGADLIGDLRLGEWTKVPLSGKEVRFMPLSRGPGDGTRPRVPHVLQLAINTLRHRPSMGTAVIQAHRPLSGFVYRVLYPHNRHIQFIHNDGVDNLKRGGESYFTRARFIYRALERSAVKNSDATIVFSSSGAQRLGNYGPGVRFSPTWFDDELTANAAEASDEVDTDQLLWVGRIDASKDPVLAIETLAALPESYRLIMVGDGPLTSEVEQLVHTRRLGDRVQMIGRVPKANIAPLMAKSGALLMTSRYEGYPRVVVEALSVGLPVVTTYEGEPNELVVEGFNGARAAHRTPLELADAVGRSRTIERAAARTSADELRASVLVPKVLETTQDKRAG